MALPQIKTPTYELEVPSTGLKITYRPFLVKEQKVLMIAQEQGGEKALLKAVGNIIKDCTNGMMKTQTIYLLLIWNTSSLKLEVSQLVIK